MSRSRGFVFTLNNYTDEEERHVQSVDCAYLCYGREIAPQTGTPHLQGFVYFADGKTERTVRKLIPRAHVEPSRARDPAQAYDYCQKGGDYFERGVRPKSPHEKGQQEKDRWAGYMDSVRQKRLRDIPCEVLCKNLRGIQYAIEQIDQSEADLSPLEVADNYWIYGPQGTGKTSYVKRRISPDQLYLKCAKDERWTGYKFQDDVLIEDYGKTGSFSVDFLKRWCDEYSFPVWVHYGSLVVRPKRIIVTSNYHPSELFKGVELQAILRRFKLFYIPTLGARDDENPFVQPEIDEPGPDWSENCESI